MSVFISFGVVVILFVVPVILGFIVLCYAEFMFRPPGWFYPVILFSTIALAIGVPYLYCRVINDNTTKVANRTFTDVVKEQEICAARVGQQIGAEESFHMILGSGHRDFVLASYDTYNYYCQDGDRIWRESVPVSESYIEYISNDEKPKIVQYHEYRIETDRYKNKERETRPLDEKYYYVFYVPEGSVVETFDFN